MSPAGSGAPVSLHVVYLRSLTLKGFKSFAETASLEFEPGVTVVVGPNGSGKSNVVDAVAWVLGAQGPRTVRSSRMDDVIFAGSADRPPLGRAEVSLTIDNRSGRLPGGLAEITITRTLFRSGDSEYALNGQPCRLLDIQDLLADSGVGRQQHVIIGQGQLEQVLNARPEDRRAVIEEAAGALKHRRRRERAERRLAATDENLERLGDLVREVRRQLKPLERQAAAARAHDELARERRALRLYVLGQDLAALERRRRATDAELGMRSSEEEQVAAELAGLDAALEEITGSIATHQDGVLASRLARAERLGERCRGIAGVLAERRRSAQMAIEAAADADVVSALESESARIAAELDAAEQEADELASGAAEVSALESEAEEARAQLAAEEERVALARRDVESFSAARVACEGLERDCARDRSLSERLEEQLGAMTGRKAGLDAEAAQVASELSAIDAALPALAEEVERARQAELDAAASLEAVRAMRREAEAERHRREARAEDLAKAASDARGAQGAKLLEGIDGVAGVLADLVDVDEGWSGAFDSALGAALGAVVVEGSSAAVEALARLASAGVPGAVLALSALSGRRGAEVAPPGSPDRLLLPAGAEPLRLHVRGRSAGIEEALDWLLGSAVAVQGGWKDAARLAADRPDLMVVTREGDRFATSGWRLHANDGVVSAQAAEEARRDAEEAARRADSLAAQEVSERSAHAEATAAASGAAREHERNEARRQSLAGMAGRLAKESDGVFAEIEQLSGHLAEVKDRLSRLEIELAERRAGLAALEEAAGRAGATLEALSAARLKVEQLRARAGAARREHDVRAASLTERRKVLSQRLVEVERRLAGRVEEREQARELRSRLEAELVALGRLESLVAGLARSLDSAAAGLREAREREREDARSWALAAGAMRDQRQAAANRQVALAGRVQELRMQAAGDAVRFESLVETIRRELAVEPGEALAAPAPELPPGMDPAERLAAVEARLGELGPVNPLALAELDELAERHRFLQEQVEDVRRARRELKEVVRAVDEEVVRLFTEAFADVNEHFSDLVATLFPGGTGRLVMTDPQDPLGTGVEVEARPSGKNVRKLSLLSGGERSLVALAFLFAVFRSRPSPFYVMDEVEAALDDTNVQRLLDIFEELRSSSQLIIITHQKRTMEIADSLYGVTMRSDGVSAVISQRLRQPEPA